MKRWPARIVFVRHAQSEGNVLTVDQRAANKTATHAFPLTILGIEQALITKAHIDEMFGIDSFDALYTSYYTRAEQTMNILHDGKRSHIVDSRLAEANRGIYHFMTEDEIRNKYPEELARRDLEGYYHYRAPGGENWPDIEMRVHSFIDTIKENHADGQLLVVMHGHWFLMFEKIIRGFSINKVVELYKKHKVVGNASISVYEADYPVTLAGKPLIRKSYSLPWSGILKDSVLTEPA